MIKTDVIIIGGGATGCGIARDLALRGIAHCLIERGDFAAGATGACHGLLHSGGRYVVTDPVSARECFSENMILRRIAEKCVEQTGGLFVRLPADSKDFREQFLRGCEDMGIPAEVISSSEALELVPALNPYIVEAVKVPDCSIDPFRLCMLNIRTSQLRGGLLLTRHRVMEIVTSRGRCIGVRARDEATGEIKEIHGRVLVNATGAWANRVASLAGCEVPLSISKGSLVITNHRLTNLVINRLRPPADGDIVVPNEAVCLAGTTALTVQDPDCVGIASAEVDTIIGEASRMLPQFNHARMIRAFSGVRPLLRSDADDSREISRGFQIFDHHNGMYSIVGGKLTTFRLMAEKMVNTIMDVFGLTTPCETAERPLDGQEELSGYPLSKRLADMDNIVCECELVHRQDVERIIKQTGTKKISDIQHRTRLGMGPCQGGFCTFRALGIMNDLSVLSPDQSMHTLKGFLQSRFRGIRYALWGDQLREEQLVEYLYLGILAMEKHCELH